MRKSSVRNSQSASPSFSVTGSASSDRVYRDVYFKNNIIHSGNGSVTVRYYGHLYSNCETMKDFRKNFDSTKDLFVACNDCASHKYAAFVKVPYSD